MFNSPPGLSDAMDLAKMLAIFDLIAPLADDEIGQDSGFRIWRQTRTGLLSYPLESSAARAHLAASVYLQMALQPQIVHVVGFTEADHASSAAEVIESCSLARRAIENALNGQPDMTYDPAVKARRKILMREASVALQAIRRLALPATDDPFTDAQVLAEAVRRGILDAPQLQNNPFAPGKARTRIQNGACVSVDASGRAVSENKRLKSLMEVDR
jgi:hypothetical protein